MIYRVVVFFILAVVFQVSDAHATRYLHRTCDQVLAGSELIVRVTVIKNLPTDSHRRSCVVRVDEVLSGTLTSDIIQANRSYIRLGLPREPYKTSETLVLCLKPLPKITHNWPVHAPNTPQYMIIGADAEGEFSLVDGDVWTSSLRHIKKRVIPYTEFRSKITDRNSSSTKQRPD